MLTIYLPLASTRIPLSVVDFGSSLAPPFGVDSLYTSYSGAYCLTVVFIQVSASLFNQVSAVIAAQTNGPLVCLLLLSFPMPAFPLSILFKEFSESDGRTFDVNNFSPWC